MLTAPLPGRPHTPGLHCARSQKKEKIMIISMQGNWTVTVKSKSAAYNQRFVVSGAATGNGAHAGTTGTTVHVTGSQWTIAVQNNPGGGYQLSDTKISTPRKVGDDYTFDILSNDAGSDTDFNDLILTCSTPVNINDFIIYGKVTRYSGLCPINPCRKDLFVIESPSALIEALKNSALRKYLEEKYPERVRDDLKGPVGPFPPDPEPFKPIVIDLEQRATEPKIRRTYKRIVPETEAAKSKKSVAQPALSFRNYALVSPALISRSREFERSADTIRQLRAVESLRRPACLTAAAANVTLSFEEYDRTPAELAGGAYTGTGNRQLLGDTITDMSGNYIFRFSFDMSFPGVDDSSDIAPGEDMDTVAYPDIIVKVISLSPYAIQYESAPYYNVGNLKRINLCLPAASVQPTSVCSNGNLIGSLGNVFIGGNQNSAASISPLALRRYGDSNDLEANGKISVGSSLAGFNIDCASWYGTIDMKGCLYDPAKTPAQNRIRWYTIRIRRAGTSHWEFVSQNYKHPKFSKRNLPNYTGDDVGPFPYPLHVDGGAVQTAPAYKNIQREIFVDGVDWEFSNLDRYMQLNTRLYDIIAGEHTPGTFHVRVDCYDQAGNPVAGGTDMIALYIHNNPLKFALGRPEFTDPAIVNSGCGLYRLSDSQLNAAVQLLFKANDPEGFVDSYALTVSRCPAPMIALQINAPTSLPDTASASVVTLAGGDAGGSTPHACSGYSGTLQEFGDDELITLEFQPGASESGWIKSGEYFTSLSFTLKARKRMTNGYNSGVSDWYVSYASLHMERIAP